MSDITEEELTILEDEISGRQYYIVEIIQIKDDGDSIYLVNNEEGEEYVAKVGERGNKELINEAKFLSELNELIPDYVPSLPYSPDRLLNYDPYLHKYFILMPYIPYSLQDFLDNNRSLPTLTEDQIETLAILLLKMLKELHRYGIVHCDLKPANILSYNSIIDQNSHLVLIDFGLSTHLYPNRSSTCKGGTVNYVTTQYTSTKFSPANIKIDLESVGYILLAFTYKISGRRLPWATYGDIIEDVRRRKLEIQNFLLRSKEPLFVKLGQYFDTLNKINVRIGYQLDYDKLYDQLISIFETVTEVIPILPTTGKLGPD